MKVGFIGLGIMGRPMAGHLIDAGHELSLYDIQPVPDELTVKGGTACKSGKEVAEKADQSWAGSPAVRVGGTAKDWPAERPPTPAELVEKGVLPL